jgi:hypothetical protein
MLKHQNSNSWNPVTEIISVKNLKLISWEKKENFLVIKRLGGKLILIGLREYLEKLRKNKNSQIL